MLEQGSYTQYFHLVYKNQKKKDIKYRKLCDISGKNKQLTSLKRIHDANLSMMHPKLQLLVQTMKFKNYSSQIKGLSQTAYSHTHCAVVYKHHYILLKSYKLKQEAQLTVKTDIRKDQ